MLFCCKKYLKVGPHIPKIVFSPLGECEPTDGYDSQHRAAKHTVWQHDKGARVDLENSWKTQSEQIRDSEAGNLN